MNNLPYQSYVNQGYFKVVENHYEYPQGYINVNLKTVVFQKGVDFIRKLAKDNGLVSVRSNTLF